MNKEEMMIQLKRIKPLFILLGGGALLTVSFQMLLSAVLPLGAGQKLGQAQIQTATVVNAFQDIALEARAAYVLDLNTEDVLFALNENEKLPLASITKLMTAFVARDHAPESALVTITRDDLSAEGDSGLHGAERWRLEDLINTMLVISSNDAAHAVARFIGSEGQSVSSEKENDSRVHFVEMMNTKARELGLSQMQFFNESGLDIESSSIASGPLNGGYGSAHDVALLFEELWRKYPSTIEITVLPAARIVSQDNIVHVLPNTDEAIGKYSGLIASKTGYTALAGGNLAIIFDRGINNPVVAVVLGSTLKGRFDDMAKLVAAVTRMPVQVK